MCDYVQWFLVWGKIFIVKFFHQIFLVVLVTDILHQQYILIVKVLAIINYHIYTILQWINRFHIRIHIMVDYF